MKERKLSGKMLAALVPAVTLAGCAGTEKETAIDGYFTNEERVQTSTPVPATETPTPIPAPTQTPTITPTPTFNWRATNEARMLEHVEGESFELLNVRLDKIVIINPPGIKELFYGAITDEEDKVEFLIENFDCQFRELRERGELGDIVDRGSLPFNWRAWDISEVVFSELQITKDTDLPVAGVGVFTSESFRLSEGESKIVCAEDPVLRPVTEEGRRLFERFRRFVITLVEETKD